MQPRNRPANDSTVDDARRAPNLPDTLDILMLPLSSQQIREINRVTARRIRALQQEVAGE